MILKAGTILGERYEIVSKVGSGGMADVYRARDHKLNRYVAVKVMKQEFSEDSAFITKFRREAQAAAGLANPNIVNVFDVGEDRGNYYIVMELVEGTTLKEYINKKGRISVREAISIAIQVCMGLSAAHAQNIVHRDVKPQNIIISNDGKVKVTDFGIARATSSNTISSNAMGSVHYSSPEQVRGGFADARSDIYSVGITLYEMVTGRVPFDGDSAVNIAIKHLQDEMEPPSKYAQDLPYSLEQIIYKCTQKDVNRRYQTVEEVIADLKRCLSDPNGRFVTLTPLSNHARTVMFSPAEQAAIRAQDVQAAERSNTTDEDEFYEDADDEEYYDDRDYDEEDDYYDDEEDDDDDDGGAGGLSSGLEKAVTIGGFVIAAVIIAILLYFIAKAAGLFKNNNNDNSTAVDSAISVTVTPTPSPTETPTPTPTEVPVETATVPSILGMSESDARTTVEQFGFTLRYTGDSYSDDYGEGLVALQSPEAGTEAEVGSAVEYVRSSGYTPITVPGDLIGKTEAQVISALEEAGFSNHTVSYWPSDEYDSGLVFSVNPGEGSAATKDTTIAISVSTGKANTITVGNYTGMSISEATAKAQADGFAVSTREGSDDSMPYNYVIYQNYTAGTEAPANTTILLTVNTSNAQADPTPTPAASTGQWVANAALQGPVDKYTGGDYRLDLVQIVNGQTVSRTFETGTALTFPHNVSVVGADGVASGTIQLYNVNGADRELIAYWEVPFSQAG